jgi:hypothetical protein
MNSPELPSTITQDFPLITHYPDKHLLKFPQNIFKRQKKTAKILLCHFKAVATFPIHCPRQTATLTSLRTPQKHSREKTPTSVHLSIDKVQRSSTALHAPNTHSCGGGCLAKARCRFRTQTVLKRKRVKRVSLVNPFKNFHFLHLFRDAEIISGSEVSLDALQVHLLVATNILELLEASHSVSYCASNGMMESRISDEFLGVRGAFYEQRRFSPGFPPFQEL